MKYQGTSEQTNETLLLNRKLLLAVLIVTPILLIAILVIVHFSGKGSITLPACVLIPNAIFTYYMFRKINKELKSREKLQ